LEAPGFQPLRAYQVKTRFSEFCFFKRVNSCRYVEASLVRAKATAQAQQIVLNAQNAGFQLLFQVGLCTS
jgi:hypothetical protein